MSCVLDFTFTVLRKIKHVNKNVDSGHPKNQFTNGEVQQNVGSSCLLPSTVTIFFSVSLMYLYFVNNLLAFTALSHF